jgi:hypothetical protein
VTNAMERPFFVRTDAVSLSQDLGSTPSAFVSKYSNMGLGWYFSSRQCKPRRSGKAFFQAIS